MRWSWSHRWGEQHSSCADTRPLGRCPSTSVHLPAFVHAMAEGHALAEVGRLPLH